MACVDYNAWARDCIRKGKAFIMCRKIAVDKNYKTARRGRKELLDFMMADTRKKAKR